MLTLPPRPSAPFSHDFQFQCDFLAHRKRRPVHQNIEFKSVQNPLHGGRNLILAEPAIAGVDSHGQGNRFFDPTDAENAFCLVRLEAALVGKRGPGTWGS